MRRIGTREPFPEKFELRFIELRKFLKRENELKTSHDHWLYLVRYLWKMQEPPKFLNRPVFEKLFDITDIENIRKEDRPMLIDRERDRRNQDAVLKREARAEGLEQGRLEGEKAKEFIFVQTLIRDTDFDDQKIAALAGVEENLVRDVRSGMAVC